MVSLRRYWINELRTARTTGNDERIVHALRRVEELTKKMRELNCYEPIDTRYKKIQYTRYADDFIIGVIGSKRDAEEIKKKVGKFLRDELNLILSEEKTKVTHSSERIRFLGYEILVSRSMDYKRDKNGHLKRCWYGSVKLYMPHEKVKSKLLEYNAMSIKKCKNGKEIWKPHYRGKLINMPDAQIVSKFNSEIRGLYNFYRLADNVAYEMHKFYYIMKVSLNKTFGCKYRTTYKHICEKYKRNGVFTVTYPKKHGYGKVEFYHEGFRKNNKPAPDFVEIQPNYRAYTKKTGLIHRMQSGVCELCGMETDDITMHHVRKLKDLEGEKEWERRMIDIRRKSLAVCPKCFEMIKQSDL